MAQVTSAGCLVCECRLTVFWVDCKCFLYTDRFKSTAHTTLNDVPKMFWKLSKILNIGLVQSIHFPRTPAEAEMAWQLAWQLTINTNHKNVFPR